MWTIVAPNSEVYDQALGILRANYLVPFAQVITDLTLYPIAMDVPAPVRKQLESLGCSVTRRR